MGIYTPYFMAGHMSNAKIFTSGRVNKQKYMKDSVFSCLVHPGYNKLLKRKCPTRDVV